VEETASKGRGLRFDQDDETHGSHVNQLAALFRGANLVTGVLLHGRPARASLEPREVPDCVMPDGSASAEGGFA